VEGLLQRVLRISDRPALSPGVCRRPRPSLSGPVVGARGGRTSSLPALTLGRLSCARRSRICARWHR